MRIFDKKTKFIIGSILGSSVLVGSSFVLLSNTQSKSFESSTNYNSTNSFTNKKTLHNRSKKYVNTSLEETEIVTNGNFINMGEGDESLSKDILEKFQSESNVRVLTSIKKILWYKRGEIFNMIPEDDKPSALFDEENHYKIFDIGREFTVSDSKDFEPSCNIVIDPAKGTIWIKKINLLRWYAKVGDKIEVVDFDAKADNKHFDNIRISGFLFDYNISLSSIDNNIVNISIISVGSILALLVIATVIYIKFIV